MDLVARKKLNLEVLKRHDPNITDILDQSAHAVVYKFDIEKKSWEKLGYEGVMFLTKGLSIENYCLNLTDFEDINLTDEFIIYQTTEGEACAIWLFEKKDRERILAKVQKLHEGIKNLPATPKKQQQQPEPKVDILEMLKRGSTKSTPIPEKQQQQQQPIQQNSPKQTTDLLGLLKKASIQTQPENELRRVPEPSEQQQQKPPVNLIVPTMTPQPPTAPPVPNARNLSLLQVLQNGITPPVPPPIPPQQPLLPQHQLMSLMQPEIARRFNGRPLSKPEFIQQVLHMIQRDPLLLDSLYESYKAQMVPPPF
ncbi:hypothetical protein RMATCC62417_05766 [Rhizopus microsporus]|nr:hypothetical protein RMATCC62417_05766 [Rhizopus microsporus]